MSCSTAAVTSTCSAPATRPRGGCGGRSRARRRRHRAPAPDHRRPRRPGPQELVGPQPQRQRVRPGLTVAGVPLGRQLTEVEQQVVAVRPDERLPALDLARAGAAELGGHRLGQRGAAGSSPSPRALHSALAVRRPGSSGAEDGQAGGVETCRPASRTYGASRATRNSRAASSSPPSAASWASHTSRVELDGAPESSRTGSRWHLPRPWPGTPLEQGAALAQHLVESDRTPRTAGRGGRQAVEEPAAAVRVTLDQGEVPGAKSTERSTRAPCAAAGRGTVQRARFARPGVILSSTTGVRPSRSTAVRDDGPLGPGAHQRRVGGDLVPAERGDAAARPDQTVLPARSGRRARGGRGGGPS